MNKSTSVPQNKNIIFWAYQSILILIVLFLLFSNIFRNDKVAYVDSAKILNEYKGAQEAKKEYEKKAKVWEGNVETLTNEIKTSILNYEKGMSKMPPKEQMLSKQLIQTKQKQLNDYQTAIQQNAQDEKNKLLQGVVSQVNAFLTQYGKDNNYKLILIANQSGTIAYGRDGLDITKDVLEKLNNDYKLNGK